MTRVAARLRVEGRVQGVGYRWWTVETARALGLDGWVRNRRDGAVEIMAIGDADAIDDLERSCRQGPAHAHVTAVRRMLGEDDATHGFEQRPTA